jgi:hypothetical protein
LLLAAWLHAAGQLRIRALDGMPSHLHCVACRRPHGVRTVLRCGNNAKAVKGHCQAQEGHIYLLGAGGKALALVHGSGELARCIVMQG